MMITAERLKSFIGQQAEIRTPSALFRGEVGGLALSDNGLRLDFRWLARGRGYPSHLDWVLDKARDHFINFNYADVKELEDGRLLICANHADEIIIFYASAADALDPARVKGLEF